MLSADIKERVTYANKKHSELTRNFTLFSDAAIAMKHNLKQSGVEVELKDNNLHAYFLGEELIFKYKSIVHDNDIKGSITVDHRAKQLDHNFKVTFITEFYFDRHGNVYDSPDMRTSQLILDNEIDVRFMIMDAASKFLDSDYFQPRRLDVD
jgi:hypothetical protein